ncbi:hypothetical protein GY45DRAFT_1306577 [Cubamyces sp. BRFM 1775]|nr:hypothetical protein GY45DRAFT_1306577 [Cubamyces sp. BRFM 1775]
MSTRQRSAATSRRDAYGLWPPSDSDTDRPRQTMASTQRHNVDKTVAAEGSRRHRSSRRTDAADASAAHDYHKSSSKERTSATQQSSYHGVPQSSYASSQHRTKESYPDAYVLRDYIKKKSDKRSPRSSKEKVLASDNQYSSRPGHPGRHDYTASAAYAQQSATTNWYLNPPEQTSRDPTSSSRHHRERDKDREKSSRRDVDRPDARDRTYEKSEDRERRRRKEREREAAKEKERVSKDRDRPREKERTRDREVRAAADPKPADATNPYQAYAATAQSSADRLPAGYTDYGRTQASQPTTTTSAPWYGLTAGGRTVPTHAPSPAVDAGYPSASDREDPPLPIPPPGHNRERSSSKTHRSRPQVLAQQAGQDSGISSSEQEHSVRERTRVSDRRYASREQGSILGRGQSSGPSGSENEKPPTIQKERRKHRTHGESSRHKSKAVAPESQPGPTSSQEIASAWYNQHQQERNGSGAKSAAPNGSSPQRPATAMANDSAPTQSGAPFTGKPTSHGPADSNITLPKSHSATSIARQADAQPVERAYETAYRSQTNQQYYQASAPGPSAHVDPSRTHQQSTVTTGAPRTQQPPQGYSGTVGHSRHADSSGLISSTMHGSQQTLPDVVVRPPSAAPTQHDPYASRDAPPALPSQYTSAGLSGTRLQVPSSDPRSRSTPAPGHSHAAQAAAQQAPYSHTQTSAQHIETDAYRTAYADAQYGSTHGKAAHHDLPSRFPVNEDINETAHASSAQTPGYGSQHTGVAYTTATSRTAAAASQGQPSASPKRNMTYPGASAPPRPPSVHVNPSTYPTGYDPRSPKPPVVAMVPETQGSRSYGHAHGREPSGQSTHHQPSPRHEQHAVQPVTNAGQAYASGVGGHSPSRYHLPDPGRSPAVGHAISAGSASGTPKHSPSGRLHSHRNGSNDTITHAAPTKPSPSSLSRQQLPHDSSAMNAQAHVTSRTDNASASRQPNASSGYPDPARYRSPAPPGYPTAQPPSSAPNGAAPSHSQSYSTQTPITAYDHQYGRMPASATQATFPSQYPQASTQTQSRSAQAAEYGQRAQDPPHSAPPTTTTMPISSQRVPPRTVASPAPNTVRPTRHAAVSTPPGKAPVPLQSAPPQPTRNQTYPAPAPVAHSRTVSDPQYAGRTGAASAYPSASLSSRTQGQSSRAPPAAAPAQQPDVLLTPSSLAPSMLPQVTPVPLGRTTSKTSTKEKEKDKERDKEKKKGFFGISLFRSRSSPPKPRDVDPPPPPSTTVRERRQRNVSQPTQPLSYMQAQNVAVKSPAGVSAPQVATVAAVSIPATMPAQSQPQSQPPSQPPPQTQPQPQSQYQPQPQPQPQPQAYPQPSYQADAYNQHQYQAQYAPQQRSRHQQQHQRGNPSLQIPIAAPTPVPAASGERSPSGKMFTPFRLLSRKHRTVSAASVEAVEGTVVNTLLTGGESTRSSTVGRPSPPLRDPLVAAQEWRNREEYEQQVRGKIRRRRPGVTFDVAEDLPDESRVPLQKSLRANIAEMQAAGAPAPAQAQSQAQAPPAPSRQATA